MKRIENRTWRTNYRGPMLIHASAHRPSRKEWREVVEFCRARGVELPAPEDLKYGGIVGRASITDCVTTSGDPWFEGPVGWVLEKAKELEFIKMSGKLGIFPV